MRWLENLFSKGAYVGLLEEERVRLLGELVGERARHIDELERFRTAISDLRKENRGLVSSLLGTAGLPPVTEEDHTPLPHVGRRSWHQIQNRTERETTARAVARARQEENGAPNGAQPEPDAKASA
jgi:hypothetical protein